MTADFVEIQYQLDSPTNVYADADVTQFYYELKDATVSVPAHNVLTIAGDFNTQTEPEDAAFFLPSTRQLTVTVN